MTTPMQSMKRFGQDALATPANFVTLGRLLLAVPTLFLIERDGSTWLTWGLWFFLCATDSIDGWMARRHGTTRSGAFLDPIADKVLTLGGFLALVSRGDIWWLPVVLMAAREVGISAYRVVAGKRGISLPAAKLGKYKAFLQMLTVGGFVWPLTSDIHWLTDSLLWFAVALTIISGLDIVRRGYQEAKA
ncbi:MAG: CDP-diacylglycerol--glycerol-3-phosphate 3-phosphatidyltransferase [Acidimicrobiia bacterium]